MPLVITRSGQTMPEGNRWFLCYYGKQWNVKLCSFQTSSSRDSIASSHPHRLSVLVNPSANCGFCSLSCQFGRIYNHHGNKPLGLFVRDVLHLINCGRNSLNLGSTLPWDEVQDWVKQAQVAEQCHQNFLLPDCGRDVTDQLVLHNELHALSMLAKTNPSRLRLLSVRYLVTVRRNMTHTFPYMQFNHFLSYGEIVFQDYQARATFPRLQHSRLFLPVYPSLWRSQPWYLH